MGFVILILCIILWLILLSWLRGEGKGSKLGQGIRNSDHWAWEMAVKDKKQELAELEDVGPTQ